VKSPAELRKSPTAVQAAAVAQETALNVLLVAPDSVGVACTVQPVGDQPTARVCWVPKKSTYWPTAVQDVAVLHFTPLRALEVVPVGTAAVWTVQTRPFQPSTRL
jgi:hypothetical protein